MTSEIKIALCQLNPTTGDFEGNFNRAKAAVENNNADIYVFPECYVTGYTAGDLFLHRAFVTEAESWLAKYTDLVTGTSKTIIIGSPVRGALPLGGTEADRKPLNAVVAITRNGPAVISHKGHLPNYDVFDDERWFQTARNKLPATPLRYSKTKLELDSGTEISDEVKIGLCVCEDIWFDDVTRSLADAGSEIIISINSSPYAIAKSNFRRGVFKSRVEETGLPLIYVNQVGGNDELVWDGASAVLDPDGNFYESDPWKETVDVITLAPNADGKWRLSTTKDPAVQDFAVERYTAACIGLRDYLAKNGFKKAVLGFSGGADSTLVGLMAADVLGEQNVDFILMPTNYTSEDSNTLAAALAYGMGTGAKAVTVPVQPMFDVYNASFLAAFGETKVNVAEENLQAQMRGDILSWYSNKFGNMILSTGNKSEIAMGYATLYGDMRGGYNPLKDLYKTEVFEIMEMRLKAAEDWKRSDFAKQFEGVFGYLPVNLDEKAKAALRGVIDRPPSAELAEGQKDSDSLPDYPVLDKILWNMIDHKESLSDEQVAEETGYDLALVQSIRRKVRIMEYKRFQSCPGPKIHRKAFTNTDWRFPMASKYRA